MESDDFYPGSGLTETITALKENKIRVFGLRSLPSSPEAVRDIINIASATDGSIYALSSDITEMTNDIVAQLKMAKNNHEIALPQAEITLEQIAGDEWITNLTPTSYPNATAGSEVQFTVTLEGQKAQSLIDLNEEVDFWAKGNGYLLLQRIKIPIRNSVE